MVERIKRKLQGDDRGAVLVLLAGALVVLMGMAAFAVDLGWLFLNGARAQKAAEAGALAGVVYLPLKPGDPLPGSTADVVAHNLARRNGYAHGINGAQVATSIGATNNQLEVRVAGPVDTFFMRIFGFDTMTVARTATAEQLPVIKLGGRADSLGLQEAQGFWVAVNGEHTSIEQGDHRSTKCKNSTSPHPDVLTCDYDNDPATVSDPTYEAYYADPAYYYAIDVKGMGTLDIDFFDAPNFDNASQTDPDPADPEVFGSGDDISNAASRDGVATTYALYPPDNTPNNPEDNRFANPAECSYTFLPEDAVPLTHPYTGAPITIADYKTAFQYQWTEAPDCDVAAPVEGRWVLEVIADNGTANNNFGVRQGGTAPVDLFAVEWLSIHSSSDVDTTFDVAEIPAEYAGRVINVILYDPGEAAGDSFLTLGQEGNVQDCRFRVRDKFGRYLDASNNVIPDPGPNDGWRDDAAGPDCQIQTSGVAVAIDPAGCADGPTVSECRGYNGQFLEIEFVLADTYSCTPSCWWTVFYDYPAAASVTDRTTWGIQVRGQPIHLVHNYTTTTTTSTTGP